MLLMLLNLKLIYLLPCNSSDDERFSYKMLPQNHSLKLRAKLANLNIRNSLYLETLPNFILSIKMKKSCFDHKYITSYLVVLSNK